MSDSSQRMYMFWHTSRTCSTLWRDVYITVRSNEFCLIHTANQPNRLDYPHHELTLHDDCEPSLIFTAIAIKDGLILCNIFRIKLVQTATPIVDAAFGI